MPISLRQFAVAVLLVVAGCGPAPLDIAPAVTQISGRVLDATTGAGIANVAVSTTPSTQTTTSGADGSFRVENIPGGSYIVSAAKPGFSNATAAVMVQEGQATTADLQLQQLGPELQINTGLLDFGLSATALSVTLSNHWGIGTVNWSATTNQSWLAVAPASGAIATAPMDLSIQVVRSLLPIGTSSGRIVVQSDAGTQTVDVTVVRTNPALPQLSVSPTAVSSGDQLSVQHLVVVNSGTGSLIWNASSSAGWLSVAPPSGTTATGQADSVTLVVDRSKITPGSSLTTQVTVSSNGGTVVVPVAVSSTAAPILATSTATVDFGETDQTRTVGVQNVGLGTLLWQASTTATWLHATPASGTNDGSLTLTADRTSLAPGTYSASLIVTSNAGTATVAAQLTVPAAAGHWSAVASLAGIHARTISATSDVDVWVGGYASYNDNSAELYHWDGTRWSDVSALLDMSQGAYSVDALSFSSPTVGVAVGHTVSDSHPVIARFDGNRFSPVTIAGASNSYAAWLPVASATSGGDAWVSVMQGTLHHVVGTQTSAFPLSGSTVNGLSFTSPSNGWAATGSALFHFDGSGWSTVSPVNDYPSWYDVASLSPTLAFATGSSGTYRFDGRIWKEIRTDQGDRVYADHIAMASTTLGWLMSSYTIYELDASVWHQVSMPTSATLSAITGAGGGWAVGYVDQSGSTSTSVILRYR